MKALQKVGAALLMVIGIFLVSHTRDVAALEGMAQAVGPGLAMVIDLTAAAVLMMGGMD